MAEGQQAELARAVREEQVPAVEWEAQGVLLRGPAIREEAGTPAAWARAEEAVEAGRVAAWAPVTPVAGWDQVALVAGWAPVAGLVQAWAEDDN